MHFGLFLSHDNVRAGSPFQIFTAALYSAIYIMRRRLGMRSEEEFGVSLPFLILENL